MHRGKHMTQETVKRENNALRIITAVMMLFIAVDHYYSQLTINGADVHDIVRSMGSFVIPTFVLISGYFCFSKDGHAEANIKKKAIHILLVILIFKITYLILSTILWIAGIVDFNYIIEELLIVSPQYVFDCYGGTVGIMTSQPIWFVYSLFLIYGLWFLLYHFKIDFKWSWLLAAPILIVSLLVAEFLPLFGVWEIAGKDVNGLAGNLYPFITLPFFVIGYYLHKYKERIDERFTNGMIWMMIIIGAVMLCVEEYLRPNNQIIYVGSVVFAVFVFLGTFRVPEDRARCSVLEYMGKYLTIWMYVFFAATNFIFRYLFQPYADSMLICEVVGPLAALALDIILAYSFNLFLKSMSAKKKAAKKEQAPEVAA